MFQSHSSEGIKFQISSICPPFLLVSTSHLNLLCKVQQRTHFETRTLLHQSPTRAVVAPPVVRVPSGCRDCTRAFCTSFWQEWGQQDHHSLTTASPSHLALQQIQWFRSPQGEGSWELAAPLTVTSHWVLLFQLQSSPTCFNSAGRKEQEQQPRCQHKGS